MSKPTFLAAAEGMPNINRRTVIGGIALLSGGAGMAAGISAEAPADELSTAQEQLHKALRAAFLIGAMPPDERQHALAALKGELQRRSEA